MGADHVDVAEAALDGLALARRGGARGAKDDVDGLGAQLDDLLADHQQPALVLVGRLDPALDDGVRLRGPRRRHLHERRLGGVDQRRGLSEVALEHRQLAAQRRGGAVLAAGLQDLDVVVDGALRDADRHRRGLGDEQRHDRAAAVDRVLVHVAARELDLRALGVGRGHRVVLGHEQVLDHHAARPGAAHAEGVPVVDDRVRLAREGRPAGVPRFALHGDPADEVRGRVAARAVVPPAVEAVAAVDADRPRRQVRQRAAEVTVAEQLDLTLLGPHGHGVRVAGGERVDPAARGTAARELDGHAQEGLQPELEPAEAPRLDDPEEAGLDVVAVGLVGEAAERLAFSLALAQRVAHRGGPCHQLVRVADVRSPDAHLRRGCYAMAQPVLRSPAAMPLTVSSSARATAGSGWRPAARSSRKRDMSVTCMRCSGAR